MEIIRTVINSDLKDIKKFRDRFIGILYDKDFGDSEVFKLRLILDELTANSYKHGNKEDIEKHIEISVIFTDDYSLIKVKDEGVGIGKRKAMGKFEESGRGIDLLYKLSDGVVINNSTVACLVKNS